MHKFVFPFSLKGLSSKNFLKKVFSYKNHEYLLFKHYLCNVYELGSRFHYAQGATATFEPCNSLAISTERKKHLAIAHSTVGANTVGLDQSGAH